MASSFEATRDALSTLGTGGVMLVSVSIGAVVYISAASENSRPARMLAEYEKGLQRYLTFLWISMSARKLIVYQAVAFVASLIVAALANRSSFLLLSAFIALAPSLDLRQRVKKRVALLEAQLDNWLLAFANSLRATASIGEAIGTTASILRAPIAQELDLVLKELRLGASVDEALLSMSRRIGSPPVSGALSAIIIGRNTGGDMPKMLETTAAALRESQRLDGVLRTKTAEGRAQSVVLSIMPFAMVGAIYLLSPEWLNPLVETLWGGIIIAVALTLWLGAFLMARKILAVDM